MTSLAHLWPWALGASVVALTAMGVILTKMLKAARAKVPMVPAPSDDAAAPGAAAAAAGASSTGGPGSLALRRSFVTGIRTLRRLTPQSSQRLATPWVLSIGEAGAGKSALLDSLQLHRLGEATNNDGPVGEPGCSWHFFERGVVLDIGGSLIFDPETNQGDHGAWKSLIALLNRYRPERPADAILLSIPATDLVGPQRLPRDNLIEKAAHIEARLTELQRGLSLRLPIYIVITKCDRVPGFTAFCRTLWGDHRQEILGWSSPYSPGTVFSVSWVEEALGVMSRAIQDAEFAAFAGAAEDEVVDPEELVLLPPRVMAMAPALRYLLGRVFRPSSYDQGPPLRGIYLTGDAERAALPSDGGPAPESTASARLTGELPSNLLTTESSISALSEPAAPTLSSVRPFLRDLFNDKIFAERGLARASSRVFPSRSRRILAMQVATAAVIVLGPLSLWWADTGVHVGVYQATRGVSANMQSLLGLLRQISVTEDQISATGNTQGVPVFPLLDAMGDVNRTHFASVFLPTSLVSPLRGQVTKTIQTSFERVVLPEFSRELENRMRHAIAEPLAPLGPGGPSPSLPGYISDLTTLNENIARFNRLATPGYANARDLAALVEYLYGEHMGQEFLAYDAYFRTAFANAAVSPVQVGARQQALAVQRAGAIAQRSFAAVLSRLSGAPAATTDRSVAASADVQAVLALRAFLDTAGPVDQALSHIRPPFLFGDAFAKAVHDSLTFYRDRLTGEIAARYGGRGQRPAATLRSVDALLRQRFMQGTGERAVPGSIPSGTDLSWDPVRLDEAIAIGTSYESFLEHGLDSLPDGLRGVVRRLAAAQTGASMAATVGDAVTFQPVFPGPRHESVHDLHATVEAFDHSAQRLSQILDQLDRLGATSQVDSLQALSVAGAAAVLARIDSSADLGGRYLLPSPVVAGWNGQAPFSAALGARESGLSDFLQSQTDALRAAAALARPVVAFLSAQGETDDDTRSLRSWQDAFEALDGLDKKPAAGPLAMLDKTFIPAIDSIDVRTCLARPWARSFGSADFVSRRLETIRRVVWQRCADVATTSARTTYLQLQDTFDRRLAGRFPFSAHPGADDAAPADIVAFLRDYDRIGPDAIAAFTISAPRVAAFLTDIGAVRQFFAPLLDSASRAPTFDYLVEFRVNRAHESGANQIADWSLDVGAQHAEIDAGTAARQGRWHSGDSVVAQLRWATGSSVIPIATDGLGAVARDGMLSVGVGGQWSLLRLLRAHAADPDDSGDRQTLMLSARTAQRLTPAEAGPPARAFIRLRFFDPDTKAELRLPRFPTSAPSIAEGAP